MHCLEREKSWTANHYIKKEENMKYLYSVFIIVHLLISCNMSMEERHKDKVKYDVGASAARGYPAEIVLGSYLGDANIPY